MDTKSVTYTVKFIFHVPVWFGHMEFHANCINGSHITNLQAIPELLIFLCQSATLK